MQVVNFSSVFTNQFNKYPRKSLVIRKFSLQKSITKSCSQWRFSYYWIFIQLLNQHSTLLIAWIEIIHKIYKHCVIILFLEWLEVGFCMQISYADWCSLFKWQLIFFFRINEEDSSVVPTIIQSFMFKKTYFAVKNLCVIRQKYFQSKKAAN